MLEPSQFDVNETWIIFRLNDAPICTEQDGDFNVVCLMDAASCYILGNAFVPVHVDTLPEYAVAELLQSGESKAKLLAPKILVSAQLGTAGLDAMVKSFGVTFKTATEAELLPFTEEAREGFREYVSGDRLQ